MPFFTNTTDKLGKLYRFLPVQLVLLHFRKYQLLLVFWLIIISTITGHFARSFGASTLFLAPEYQGCISAISMMLLGGAMAAFIMAWHISTFIIHSKRIPYLGATRHAFLKYCINNSILPLAFLVFYSIMSIRFQVREGDAGIGAILLRQVGFYAGLNFTIFISFAYFFRVGRDLLKTVLAAIANPAKVREIIPYDTLDLELDMVRADTYISGRGKILNVKALDRYPQRLLNTILRRHHRNAIFATFFSLLLLFILGIFMDKPALRIPAGAGFLILCSVMISLVAAIKYFLRSWEMIGWVILIALVSLMVKWKVFDLRSTANGITYNQAEELQPKYNYDALTSLYTTEKYEQDKQLGLQRLNAWKQLQDSTEQPPLIVISVSGGGSRAAYWTLRCLQYADSISQGKLYKNCVLITGASGGLIGASYWRNLEYAYSTGKIEKLYDEHYLENIGKDLLNVIMFSLVSVDFLSPFNKISFSKKSHSNDRGYAMEQELIGNTEGLLDYNLGDFLLPEAQGKTPALIINGTIVNDGRRLMMSTQPASYLCKPAYSLSDRLAPIDAVDFVSFFHAQNPYGLRLTSALRMNATFPYILPVTKLPSRPEMNVMDAGLRDNFGTEVTSRFLFVFKDWMLANARNVVWLEVRDTRDYEVFPPTSQKGFVEMLLAPATVIQHKWEPFQSYYQGYMKDLTIKNMGPKFKFLSLQYTPEKGKNTAALNFHLTENEKRSLYQAVENPTNMAVFDSLRILLR